MFSRWAALLSVGDTPCRSVLADRLRSSYKPSCNVVQLGGDEPVANFSGLLKMRKPKRLVNFKGLRQTRLFAIVRNDDSEPRLYTKAWSTDTEWQGPEGDGEEGHR
jgi:hypothetical protein